MDWGSFALVFLILLLLGYIAHTLDALLDELRGWRAEWAKRPEVKDEPVNARPAPREYVAPVSSVGVPGTAELLQRHGTDWRKIATVRVGSAAAERGKKKGYALRENGVLVEGKE